MCLAFVLCTNQFIFDSLKVNQVKSFGSWEKPTTLSRKTKSAEINLSMLNVFQRTANLEV